MILTIFRSSFSFPVAILAPQSSTCLQGGQALLQLCQFRLGGSSMAIPWKFPTCLHGFVCGVCNIREKGLPMGRWTHIFSSTLRESNMAMENSMKYTTNGDIKWFECEHHPGIFQQAKFDYQRVGKNKAMDIHQSNQALQSFSQLHPEFRTSTSAITSLSTLRNTSPARWCNAQRWARLLRGCRSAGKWRAAPSWINPRLTHFHLQFTMVTSNHTVHIHVAYHN